MLKLSKYCYVVWHTLYLLGFCTQTGGGKLFFYAPHINCICQIPLMPLMLFFHPLVFITCSCNANIDDVFLRSVLHIDKPESSTVYCFGISLWSSFSAKLCCLFLFCPSFKIFFWFYHLFFPFSVTFFASNYTPFIFYFFFKWYLLYSAFISPCCLYPFICCCSHVACHSSFCFIINLFETFQSCATSISLSIDL